MAERGNCGRPPPPDFRSPNVREELAAWLAWEEAPPPDWFREAVEAVIADFPIEPGSAVYGVRAGDGALVVLCQPRGGWAFADDGTRGAALRVAFAFHLQEEAFDGQGSEPWGKAWPECPGHPHPPGPRVIDGQAVWVCPRDDRVLAAIGDLADA